jgi:hypothetical protein
MLTKKLGTEKIKDFDENFDELYDKYKKKAEDLGYTNKIKFKKEKNKIIIYVNLFP